MSGELPVATRNKRRYLVVQMDERIKDLLGRGLSPRAIPSSDSTMCHSLPPFPSCAREHYPPGGSVDRDLGPPAHEVQNCDGLQDDAVRVDEPEHGPRLYSTPQDPHDPYIPHDPFV